MGLIFNGGVKVFETLGESQKVTKSVIEGTQRVSEKPRFCQWDVSSKEAFLALF